MTYCGEKCLSRWDGENKIAVTLRCRSWNCQECSVLRTKRLIAEAIGGAPTIFLTLTIRRNATRTPVSAARDLVRSWRLLRLRIMRHRKWKRLPFIAVFEPHASGWPHVHILLRSSFIDQKWLSAQWLDITKDSFKIDIRVADNPGRRAGYCAKYISKGAAKFGTCKRYWASVDYDLRPEIVRPVLAHGFKWEREDIALARWCHAFQSCGWAVELRPFGQAYARPPPGSRPPPLAAAQEPSR